MAFCCTRYFHQLCLIKQSVCSERPRGLFRCESTVSAVQRSGLRVSVPFDGTRCWRRRQRLQRIVGQHNLNKYMSGKLICMKQIDQQGFFATICQVFSFSHSTCSATRGEEEKEENKSWICLDKRNVEEMSTS